MLFPEPVSFQEADDFLHSRQDTATHLKSREIAMMWDAEARQAAFFSARVTQAAIVSRLHDVCQSVLSGQMSRAQARRLLREYFLGEGADALAAMGFAPARRAMGISQLASLPRLELIIYQNVKMAQERGHYQQWQKVKKDFSYGIWRVGNCANHREAHLARDGKIYAFDHPIWTQSPPGGEFNCHCYRELLSEKDMKERGLSPEPLDSEFEPSSLGFDPSRPLATEPVFGRTTRQEYADISRRQCEEEKPRVQAELEQRQQEQAKRVEAAAQADAAVEQAHKAEAAEAARKAAEEAARQAEAARLEAERKAAEEAARLEAERLAAEEAARQEQARGEATAPQAREEATAPQDRGEATAPQDRGEATAPSVAKPEEEEEEEKETEEQKALRVKLEKAARRAAEKAIRKIDEEAQKAASSVPSVPEEAAQTAQDQEQWLVEYEAKKEEFRQANLDAAEKAAQSNELEIESYQVAVGRVTIMHPKPEEEYELTMKEQIGFKESEIARYRKIAEDFTEQYTPQRAKLGPPPKLIFGLKEGEKSYLSKDGKSISITVIDKEEWVRKWHEMGIPHEFEHWLHHVLVSKYPRLKYEIILAALDDWESIQKKWAKRLEKLIGKQTRETFSRLLFDKPLSSVTLEERLAITSMTDIIGCIAGGYGYGCGHQEPDYYLKQNYSNIPYSEAVANIKSLLFYGMNEKTIKRFVPKLLEIVKRMETL